MRAALIGAVKAYRLLLSPWLGAGCRFEPTCSVYAIEALQRHGSAKGSALSAWRIVRCAPWCAGGHDPVPDHWQPKLFTSLLAKTASSNPSAHPPAP